MRLHIFQSDKGDCLLLEGKGGGRILCDGGMSNSMTAHVSPRLAKLRAAKERIDIAYVSHIDQDHISGVLRLLRDELDWRIFEHHKSKGHVKVKKPTNARPPEIGGIWHNAFRDQLGGAAVKVEDMLAQSVSTLLATRLPTLQAVGEHMYQIATSIPEAIELSKLASANVLRIPVNKLPGANGPAKLLMVRKNQKPVKIGSLRLTIVGPTNDELEKLKAGWDNWLRDNGERVEKIAREVRKRLEEFSNGTPGPIDLRDWNGIPDFKGVTIPNIASLMFLVEEDGKRLLLTGDSQQEIILKGLEQTGVINREGMPGEATHVNVLKVQHHGSENNMDAAFARRISADHYVFCGNGEHENPDLGVIDTVFQSRVGGPTKRAKAPEARDRAFTMWFSSTSQVGPSGKGAIAHMRDVEKTVAGMVKKAKGQMKAVFNKGDFVTLTV
jgi:hypothetical protein